MNRAAEILNHTSVKTEFPLSFFPEKLQRIIIEVSSTYSYPIDYVCCSVLSAAATAIGNSNAIHIKSNWIENVSLFIAIIGTPGVNKSAPLNWAMMPIERREKQIYKEYLRNLRDYDQLPDKEKDKIPEPILIKTVISDATPEAVVMQLKHNPRGILILMDELSGFLNTFQRYSKGNDEQFYLSAWSGKPVVVDRKTSRSIRINDPILNIVGTIQPGVLEKSFAGKDESGFFDRWLLCDPIKAVKGYWSDHDISFISQSVYERIIFTLMDLPATVDEYDNTRPHPMTYSKDALNELKMWQRNNTDFINGSSDDITRAIRAKIEIYVHRISLVCELIDFATRQDPGYGKPEEISLESVERGILLCEYFIQMGINVRLGDPADNQPKIFKELLELIPSEIQFTFDQFCEQASMCEISESTARKWLKRNTGTNKIFTKIKHGTYARN